MEGGLLSLKWNDHSHTFFDMLSTIRRRESYCDVTLVCEGRFYPVHKLVLSTCSEFFDNLFSKTDCKHPVVIVANVSHKDLESLFNYMYLGEVNVLQTELGSLMRAAEVLRIKGLAEPTKPQEKELKNKLPHPTSSKSSGSSPKRKAGDHDTVSPPSKRSSPIKERPERRNPSDPLVASKEKDPLVSPLNNSPEAASSNERLSVRDTKSSQLEPGVSLLVADEEQDSSERAEVKMEEISIKNEPGSWFEESSDNAPYSEQDSTYNYNQQTVNYPGSCVPWAVSPVAQPNPVESHLPQGVPGASGLQGMPDFGPRSSIEQLERYRAYDTTKRIRSFVEGWREEFPWVKYDPQKREMTCTLCVQYCQGEDKSRFISGNTNFKKLALMRHDMSLVHRRCMARKEAEQKMLPLLRGFVIPKFKDISE